MTFTMRLLAGVAVVFGVGLLFTFEYPPVDVVQVGYRGTAMEQVYSPERVAAQIPANQFPAVDPLPSEGAPAGQVYQNVQVLGDVPETEFLGLMTAITEWVSPEQGCAYCHADGEDLSSDSLYTKVVARRMIQMTQTINTAWESHVGQSGVNCYTCHRGQPVPRNIWFQDAMPDTGGLLASRGGQNVASPDVGLTSLPADPYTTFLVGEPPIDIRVIGERALPHGNTASIKQAEWTYALMVHMSEGLGVNCTFCHNSRSFAQWDQSPPQRATAWYGIRMVRNLNADYLVPLGATYPPHRLGPAGDAPKAYCSTCHQGAYKPLYGAPAVADWPALDRVTMAAPPQAADVPAETPAEAPAASDAPAETPAETPAAPPAGEPPAEPAGGGQ
ncbi:MAG: photosynthetic reaction center cytochrome c subunit [Pseudomonadota bacterium]|jgi:photosynthetic reaction center cytochrome c subunit